MSASLSSTAPPLRSISNIRGDDLALVEASMAMGLDALFVDLEEPRTPLSEADRSVIRKEAGEWLRGRQRGGTRLFSRVQCSQSGQMLKDVEAIACPALEGVLVPKVEGPRDILAAEAIVSAVEVEYDLAPGSILFFPILETAKALRNAYDIVAASPRVAYMGGAVSKFGDIVQSVGYRWTPGGRESFMFRSSALVGCLAAGMHFPVTGGSQQADSALDSVRRWAQEGRALGYRGSQIRPFQPHIDIINEVYSPTAAEVAAWEAVVARAGTGPGSPSDDDVAAAHAALTWATEKGLTGVPAG